MELSLYSHKMTTLTPACHMESYGPEDHRYDLRPILYPNFHWQFKKIDELVCETELYSILEPIVICLFSFHHQVHSTENSTKAHGGGVRVHPGAAAAVAPHHSDVD